MALATYSLLHDPVDDELAHDLFQLVFAYQLMADQGANADGRRLDDPVKRDGQLGCALRAYAALLREIHRDTEAAMVLEHAQALMKAPYSEGRFHSSVA
jgi:hypothetical protein